MVSQYRRTIRSDTEPNGAHSGHQVPRSLLTLENVAGNSCPAKHFHWSGVLLFTYSLLRSSPPRDSASAFGISIDSRVFCAAVRLPHFVHHVPFPSELHRFLKVCPLSQRISISPLPSRYSAFDDSNIPCFCLTSSSIFSNVVLCSWCCSITAQNRHQPSRSTSAGLFSKTWFRRHLKLIFVFWFLYSQERHSPPWRLAAVRTFSSQSVLLIDFPKGGFLVGFWLTALLSWKRLRDSLSFLDELWSILRHRRAWNPKSSAKITYKTTLKLGVPVGVQKRWKRE